MGWKHDQSPVVVKETLLGMPSQGFKNFFMEKNEQDTECIGTVIPSGYFRYDSF